MSTLEAVELIAAHREYLNASAISDDVLTAAGITSYTTNGGGISFPWTDGTAAPVIQRRPDKPLADDNGRPMKYLFDKGAKVPYNRVRDGRTPEAPDAHRRVLICEGTKQHLVAASYAPSDFAVYGFSGCWGFKHADMTPMKGRDVFLLLDADLESNLDVWVATEEHTKRLKRHGAQSVRYVFTTATDKQGLDDVLAKLPEADRADMLKLWLSQSADKMPKRPKARKPELAADGRDDAFSKLFRKVDGNVRFMAMDGADALLADRPAALTAEDTVALYRDGVYQVDGNQFLAESVALLGNAFTPSLSNTLQKSLVGLLTGRGLILPERATLPLLNCTNGMVDLRTGALVAHDPKYLSTVQVALAYDADAACPRYEGWLRDVLRQDGAREADVDALVADIEETAGTMLDPSKTPSKALFLFGPSRSGKSTFLRLLKAVAGAANTSAVTLHQLSGDQFACANLYGKMLNVAADLSNAHVGDLSNFKMITGEDIVQANRKYGVQFTFTNQSLVAFSANELPTVSEASRAYAERMKPFEFPNSFAGDEDKTLEDKLMAELPGILVRWVKAYGRFLARGGYVKGDAATRAKFEAKSDRVVQFVQDMCELTPAAEGDRLDAAVATKRRDVASAFNAWSERNGGSKMGERAFFQRMASVNGVVVVRTGPKQVPGFNLVVAAADEDRYFADAEAAVVAEAEAALDAALAAMNVDLANGTGAVDTTVRLAVPVGRTVALNAAPRKGIRLVDVVFPADVLGLNAGGCRCVQCAGGNPFGCLNLNA